MSDRTTAREAAGLVMVIAVALGLRLWGITYGLPAVYNPDEVAIMNRALALGQNGLNPGNFLYPSLYFYVLFAWEGAWFVLGRVVGVFGSLAAFERSYFVDPTSIFIAGRALTAVLGTLTVWATWRLGTCLFGRTAGLVAGCLLAVAPLAVRDAHYVKHDVPVAFLIVLAHLFAASAIVSTSKRRTWLWAGAAAGLACSTHYYAIFAVVPILILAIAPRADSGLPTFPRSLVAATGDTATRRVAHVAVGAAVAFALTSPFLVLDPGRTWLDILGNRAIVVDRVTESAGLFGSFGYYIRSLGAESFGVVGAGLSIVGIGVVLRAGWRRSLVTLAFPLLFLAFISNTFPASRYLNAVLPFFAIAAGVGASWLSSVRQVGPAASGATVALAVVLAAVTTVQANRFFLRDDTRSLALAWLESRLPDTSSVLVQPYSVPLRPSRDGLVEALTAHLGDASRASTKFQRMLALTPYPAPAYRTLFLGTGGLDVDKLYLDPAAFSTGLEPARAAGVTHVVLKRYNVEDSAMVPIARALERDGRRLATFSPYRPDATPGERQQTAPFLHNTDVHIAPALERPGPTIEIWSIN